MGLRKTAEPFIEVISTIKGLETIPEVLPKPANKFIPDWWRETPLLEAENTRYSDFAGNVKSCPSFPDYFSNGIIVPMWTDVLLGYDDTTGEWWWKSSSNEFTFEIHGARQFLEHVPFSYAGNPAKILFKAICPWTFRTPPGYSVLQLPVFYHYTHDFMVMPGVIDTDRHPVINQQVLFTSDKKEFIIKKGTPLVQYIPFKREKYPLTVRGQNENDETMFRNYMLDFMTNFGGSKFYVNKRRQKNSGEQK